MSSTHEIKRRVKAVTNIGQITKAMEMVSANKMRRSQTNALLSRPYAVEILRILGELSTRTSYTPDIMKSRTINKTAVVLVASDRGLAGSFNTNIFRLFEKKIEKIGSETGEMIFIGVGKKAEEYLTRRNSPPARVFKNFGDCATTEEVKPLSDLLVEGFLKKDWDQVIVIFTQFRTTLRQEVVLRNILPINALETFQAVREIVPEYGRFSGLSETFSSEFAKNFEYLIEPDPKRVLDKLAPQMVKIALYDFILEANASEHSARMVAMKNASESADELKHNFTIEYNKLRQAGITREVSEIASGSESLKN